MVTLITRDSKGKVRIIEFTLTHYENPEYYEITRKSGLYQGKMVSQPSLKIEKGKVKRTLKEQAELEFNSLIKKAKDKGYKDIKDLGFDCLNFDPDKVLPKEKRDQNGAVKPMLAKQASDVKNKDIFNNVWWASRKINGTRCLIFYKDEKVTTCSRGSVKYDIPIKHIIENQVLINFFKNHPNVILDGEIYHHSPNYTLNIISGICRKQEYDPKSELLEFYWYDLIDLTLGFSDRFNLMQKYAKELNLTPFDPLKTYKNGDLQIQFLPQEKVSGWENIKNLHDKFVKEGWEGLVIRAENSKYQPGIRNNDWIKVKEYKDAEYEIVGMENGLRDEDFCFVLKTKNGQQFSCKPMGTREEKANYRKNIKQIIGKYLTIKYFEISGVPGSEVPQQPVGICIRDYE